MIRRVMGQWREFARFYYGDYYPLTSYSLDSDVWMAWQFDDPAESAGMVQAFRHADRRYESARFPLRGLEPDATYVVRNLDEETSQELTGRQLADPGLLVELRAQPDSTVILYEKRSP